MKKRTWLTLLLMAVCVLVLVAYRIVDGMVTDTKAPKITIDEDVLEVSVHDPEKVLLQGVDAWDDKDKDVSDEIIIESIGGITDEGQVTVTYAAFDRSGNVAKKSRQVRYTDYIPPRFTLNAPLAFAQGSNFDVMNHIGAVDQLDGDITHRVKVTSLSEESISAAGTYDIRLQVTNSLGDTQVLQLQTEIYPAGTYNAELKLTEYLVYLPVGAEFDEEDYLDTFAYGGQTANLSQGVYGSGRLAVSGKVDPQTPGVYTVSYTVSWGQSYTGYSKLVVVVEG